MGIAIHDELTGLLNRRGLFAVARAQLEVVQRYNIGGLLLYVDLDGLKTTNDRYGHCAGRNTSHPGWLQLVHELRHCSEEMDSRR